MGAGPKLDIKRFNAHIPEGAYLLGRFEAQAELVDFMRTLARGLDMGVDVSEALAQLIKKHDAMVEGINQQSWKPGAAEAKDRVDHATFDAENAICGKVASAQLMQLNTAARDDAGLADLPDFDPDAQDNPYAMPEED